MGVERKQGKEKQGGKGVGAVNEGWNREKKLCVGNFKYKSCRGLISKTLFCLVNRPES